MKAKAKLRDRGVKCFLKGFLLHKIITTLLHFLVPFLFAQNLLARICDSKLKVSIVFNSDKVRSAALRLLHCLQICIESRYNWFIGLLTDELLNHDVLVAPVLNSVLKQRLVAVVNIDCG